MSVFQALILGVLQGITEFLPISSSGHLILLPNFLGWEVQSLAFDTILHLGTSAALIVYFWSELPKFFNDKSFLKLILVGTIPALFFGVIFGEIIENYFRSIQYVVIFLTLGSILMFLAEKFYRKKWHSERMSYFEKLSLREGLIVGIFQSLSLLSGVSRSGSTISGGMFMGLTREAAARFSFILSIPVVIAAGVFKIFDSYQELSIDVPIIFGFIASAVTGIIVIKYLLKFLKTNNLYVFIIYIVTQSLND